MSNKEGEIIETQSSTPVEPEVVNFDNKKKKNTFPIKLILIFILIIGFVIMFIKLADMINTYRKADKFKDAHEKVQDQFRYCDSIKGESSREENFIFCREFEERFSEIPNENENE